MSEVVAGPPPLSNIGTAVFDLDGVVYVDGVGVPGAGHALETLEAAGVKVLFATNNSTKTRESAAGEIKGTTGYDCDPEQVVTSSWVTAQAIATSFRRAYVVGETGLVETLRSEGLDTTEDWRVADVVVVGLDRELTYDKLRDAVLAVQVGGAAFVATNSDVTFPTANGPVPGGGAIAQAIAAATGVEPPAYGKPHGSFGAPLRRLVEGAVAMIGDRLETDIALGKAEGWATVLVLSGVTSADDPIPEALAPDLVVGSIAEVPGLVGVVSRS